MRNVFPTQMLKIATITNTISNTPHHNQLTTTLSDLKMVDATNGNDADEYGTTLVKAATKLIRCTYAGTIKITQNNIHNIN
jgi:hypothetical protein